MSTKLKNKSGFDGTDESLIKFLPKLPELKLLVREIESQADLRAAELKHEKVEPPEGMRFKEKRQYKVWKDERLSDEGRFNKFVEAGIKIDHEDAFKMHSPASIKKLLGDGQKRFFEEEFTKDPAPKFTLETTKDLETV